MARRKNLAALPWKTLSSREIYRNRWLSLREDKVMLPNGKNSVYGVVTCSQCVGVLPFVDSKTVLLVGQYRYIAKQFMWEMPTGGVHPGEKIKGAAQRELAEETGHKAGKLTPLLAFHSSKSVMDETAHLFVGENLRKAGLKPDDTEFIQTKEFPFDKVLKMVLSGEIKDAMTVIAVLAAAQVKGA